MTQSDPLLDTITANATEPQEAAGDSIRVKMPDLDQQLDVHRYSAGRSGVNSATRGLRFTRLIPPGAC